MKKQRPKRQCPWIYTAVECVPGESAGRGSKKLQLLTTAQKMANRMMRKQGKTAGRLVSHEGELDGSIRPDLWK